MSRQLDVTMVTTELSRNAGGVFEVVCELSNALLSNQVQTTAVGLADAETYFDLNRWRGHVEPCSVIGPRRFGLAPALVRVIRESDPAVIHRHGMWRAHGWAAAQAVSRTVPRVISPHGMLTPWALGQSSFRKRLARIAFENRELRRASVVQAYTHSELKLLKEVGVRGPFAVIPNGVTVPAACSKPHNDRLRLLFLGRIHPKKGLRTLVECWSVLRPKDAVLQIVGWDDGNHLDELISIAQREGLDEDSIVFRGPVYGQEKMRLFSDADVFVLPSYSEGLPMAVLEAASFGIPVLITTECNLHRFGDANAGWIIPPEKDALVTALRRVLGSTPHELKRVGEAGRELVKAEYTWAAVAKRWTAVYEWLTGRGPQPPDVLSGD